MKLTFELTSRDAPGSLDVDLRQLVIAGWTGRDRAAIDHHIAELAMIGVRPPSDVPLFYRVASDQLTQAEAIQVVGDKTSGEVEPFVFVANGQRYVSLASDHTDRVLEARSVALSKQICAKPVAKKAWRLDEVVAHWDELVVRSFIDDHGSRVLYQEGRLSALRTPLDLLARYFGGEAAIPDGFGMTCGTVGAIGGIRPTARFEMELFDPRLDRRIHHAYRIEEIPVIA